MPPFDVEEFLVTLDTSGPQLTSCIKGDWFGLYRWLETSRIFGELSFEYHLEIQAFLCQCKFLGLVENQANGD